MRGGAPVSITADHEHGVALPVDLPSQPSQGAYTSYSFDLYDPQGKLAWTGVVAAPSESESGGERLSLVIPGANPAKRRLYYRCLRRRGSWRTHRDRPVRL